MKWTSAYSPMFKERVKILSHHFNRGLLIFTCEIDTGEQMLFSIDELNDFK